MTKRLLLVEPSATMRYVLEKHIKSLGFTVDATESYDESLHLLRNQYQQFGAEYSALVFGWPSTPQEDAAQLAQNLEQAEFRDLPVVVMSTDLRAETRAWVSARDSTAVIAWKEYQGVEELLNRLLDEVPQSNNVIPAKFDNSDIHLLVVDDSATIRHSLRDLFRMQGYKVSLAASRVEAFALATSQAFDIAVLDFYLQETTGDLLCRDLIAHQDTGDVVCTVLTGTYSDHIIKRSLRAGAVECMFKNESSELLLSRIDAISRFVRQRRELQEDRLLLEEIIESLAGAVIIVESDQRISYLSSAALIELQLESPYDLIGRSSNEILESDGPVTAGTGLHSSTWTLPDGRELPIDYEHVSIESSGRSILRFAQPKPAIEEQPSDIPIVPDNAFTSEESLIQTLALKEDCLPLLTEFQNYLNTASTLSDRVSLFVLDVFVTTDTGRTVPVSAYAALEEIVHASLKAIYKRSGHVSSLKDNRYAFLLRHSEEPQAYLLVRKIMQLCLEIDHGFHGIDLSCSGSLLSISAHDDRPMDVLMSHAFKGVDLVNTRASNQALLLDLRRMLSAYPNTDNQRIREAGAPRS